MPTPTPALNMPPTTSQLLSVTKNNDTKNTWSDLIKYGFGLLSISLVLNIIEANKKSVPRGTRGKWRVLHDYCKYKN